MTAVDTERGALPKGLDATEQTGVAGRHAEVRRENRDEPVLRAGITAVSEKGKTEEAKGGEQTHEVVLDAVARRVEHDVEAEPFAELAGRVGPVELAGVVLREGMLDDDCPDQDAAEEGQDRRRADASARCDREPLRVEEETETGRGDDAADGRQERGEGARADGKVEREEARRVAPVEPRGLRATESKVF